MSENEYKAAGWDYPNPPKAIEREPKVTELAKVLFEVNAFGEATEQMTWEVLEQDAVHDNYYFGLMIDYRQMAVAAIDWTKKQS